MVGAYDIQLRVYVSPEMYLGLRHRAETHDRTLSQHLRHLIRLDLHQACAAALEYDRGEQGPDEGHQGGRE